VKVSCAFESWAFILQPVGIDFVMHFVLTSWPN
jgi:hypothetical protein